MDRARVNKNWTTQLSDFVFLLIDSIGTTFTIAKMEPSLPDAVSGQQVWAYKLPNVRFSLRGQPAPVRLDDHYYFGRIGKYLCLTIGCH